MGKESYWLGVLRTTLVYLRPLSPISWEHVCKVSTEHLTRQFSNSASLMHPMLLKIASAPFPNEDNTTFEQNALFAV